MSLIHTANNETNTFLTNVQEGDIQPNAIDVRLDRVFIIEEADFVLTEENKTHRGTSELLPNKDGMFVLPTGHYEVVMSNIVSVGENEAGWVKTRSTLNRNGCFLTSGLYDSNYHGTMAACLHVYCGTAYIAKGARIGQYINVSSEMSHGYRGDYGFDADGTPKQMEAKYHE